MYNCAATYKALDLNTLILAPHCLNGRSGFDIALFRPLVQRHEFVAVQSEKD